MSRSVLKKTIKVAERVQAVLDAAGARSAVIGAMACAAWNYPRHTRDFDLGCATDPFTVLEKVARTLREAGLAAECRLPDGEDPLGGMLVVEGPGFRRVEVVNFYNPLRPRRTPGAQAIEGALEGRLAPSKLRLVKLTDLIALKLYAGGPKSRLDVLELVARNPDLDLNELQRTCEVAGLKREFDRLLAELRD